MRWSVAPLLAAALATAAFAVAALPAAHAEWLAPLTVEDAQTLPSGQIGVALGASYFRNRRFPAFTQQGYIDGQDLVTVPELALRAGAGSRVEIQASYEFVNLHEEFVDLPGTVHGVHRKYGGGDARLFTKVLALRERRWIPATGVRFGVKLPNANSSDRLGTDQTDFLIQLLGSKRFGQFSGHLNLGVAIVGNATGLTGRPSNLSSGQDDLFTYAIGMASPTAAIAADWGVRGLLEVAGTTGSRFANDGNAMRGGLQLLYGGWTVYAGASAGLNSAAEKYGVMGGAIYAFDVDRLTALFD
jgi:hypothetical protein